MTVIGKREIYILGRSTSSTVDELHFHNKNTFWEFKSNHPCSPQEKGEVYHYMYLPLSHSVGCSEQVLTCSNDNYILTPTSAPFDGYASILEECTIFLSLTWVGLGRLGYAGPS